MIIQFISMSYSPLQGEHDEVWRGPPRISIISRPVKQLSKKTHDEKVQRW